MSAPAVEMAECDGQHIGHIDGLAPGAHVDVHGETTRAKQSIRPARRRAVLRRDGGCCRVNGCRNATFVDVHHLRPRSEGGSDDVENLVTLCVAHHHAIHDRRLLCEGTPSAGLTFRRADGTPYGGAAVPSADTRAKASRALALMGFRESEAKRAVGRVPNAAGITLDSLLREALRGLMR